jgi:hypothetical protein
MIIREIKEEFVTKEIWLNLPVKDVGKSKEFFEKIGWTLNEKHKTDGMVCFEVGTKEMTVLFFAEETFKGFTKNEISDTKTGSEVLISFDAESRKEVGETAQKVFDAGGAIFSKPQKSKAGCMVLLSPIWTDIVGIRFLWISAKCRNNRKFTEGLESRLKTGLRTVGEYRTI